MFKTFISDIKHYIPKDQKFFYADTTFYCITGRY